MLSIFEECLFKILALIAIILSAAYMYMKYAFTYWKKKGVPYIEPTFLFGNAKESFTVKQTIGVQFANLYNIMKPKGNKHMGMYFLTKPLYIPMHPDLIKAILVKDFQYFQDRGLFHNEKDDPLSAHLFALDGEKWKNLRAKLTPTFTPGKLKKMFQTLVDCSKELTSCLNEPISKDEPIEIKQILMQYTTDVIGSCAFGIECNSFKQPNTEFIRLGRNVFNLNFIERMKFFLVIIWPGAAPLFRMRVIKEEIHNFFTKLTRETIEYRENNNIVRNDFLQLLIQLKNKGKLEEDQPTDMKSAVGTTLTDNETAAQAFLFFIAGFETSSTTMTFCCYELARNEEIQDKLRQEMVTVLKKYNGEITYDALSEMHYMEQVISEALRIYPPAPFLRRKVTKDYKIPDTDIILEKDCMVMVPMLGLHKDPEYYPNPDLFDPDRFTEENKSNRPNYIYLPFGDGPRNCIGLRFGMLQVKVGLCQLIKNYKFSINPKTIEPIEFDPKSISLCSKEAIWLTAVRATE